MREDWKRGNLEYDYCRVCQRSNSVYQDRDGLFKCLDCGAFYEREKVLDQRGNLITLNSLVEWGGNKRLEKMFNSNCDNGRHSQNENRPHSNEDQRLYKSKS